MSNKGTKRITLRPQPALQSGIGGRIGTWSVILPESQDPLALHQFKQIAGLAPSAETLKDFERLVITMRLTAACYKANFEKPFALGFIAKNDRVHGAASYLMNCFGDTRARVVLDALITANRDVHGSSVMVNGSIGVAEAEQLLLDKWKPYVEEPRIRPFNLIAAASVDSVAADLLSARGCAVFVNPSLEHLNSSVRLNPSVFSVAGGLVQMPQASVRPPIFNVEAPGIFLRGKTARLEQHQYNLALAWGVATAADRCSIAVVEFGNLVFLTTKNTSPWSAAEHVRALLSERQIRSINLSAYCDTQFDVATPIEILSKAGITIVAAPRQSIRDEKVGQQAQEWLTFVTLDP